MKKKIRKFIPMLIVMLLIFFFSCMEGDESADTSVAFLKAFVKLVKGMSHKDFSVEVLGAAHLIIRKCAHFSEYLALGVTVMLWMWDLVKTTRCGLLYPELVCMLYAATDELHQYFVPGRYGTWTDVLIDSCGAFTGIFIFYKIYKSRENKGKSGNLQIELP